MVSVVKPLVVLEGVSKRLASKPVLRGMSLEVMPGEVYCLVGPNGAGKTTTLRILAGILPPDEGRVLVAGGSPLSVDVRKRIAYMPENPGVYPRMTGYEFLRFVAAMYYEDPMEARRAAERGAEISMLGDALQEKTSTYSKGMVRRLHLAACLMVKPQVLILDEPTAGLDPGYSKSAWTLILRHVREGHTAVVSTHDLLEAGRYCDRIALIRRGRIIAEGSLPGLMSEYGVSTLEELYEVLEGGDVGLGS